MTTSTSGELGMSFEGSLMAEQLFYHSIIIKKYIVSLDEKILL